MSQVIEVLKAARSNLAMHPAENDVFTASTYLCIAVDISAGEGDLATVAAEAKSEIRKAIGDEYTFEDYMGKALGGDEHTFCNTFPYEVRQQMRLALLNNIIRKLEKQEEVQ